MTAELNYLAWVIALTVFMWIPYVMNMIMVRGLVDAVGYPDSPKPLAPWADRMKCAHMNAVENLVIFAPLVVVANLAGISNEMTVMACALYFWARVIHVVVYTMAIPWLRTASFVAGFVAQVLLVWQILL
jgi:uncharacterized MAPEG superfamily protein